MEKQQTVYERFRSEVYRIGWRVQYRAKKIRNRECSFYDREPAADSFVVSSENKLLLEQLMSTLPPRGRTIMYRLYIQDQTESEVARQLNLSQQAVNKWKRKMIQQLSRTVNS
ncbi:sigma factor-like helix-turn-helix DNA-binding protein [Paenibacillus pinihumi]|uniref:sigma factor-like helix-turn-helix DNA-binding protein n=1 Tax=Paenibacillus pinihumi TaxID=669462 RepID=UPI00041DA453|nr:sigma factor-like helix-turn-helix DNA-binding protein [Paenibacillus pinihumi]